MLELSFEKDNLRQVKHITLIPLPIFPLGTFVPLRWVAAISNFEFKRLSRFGLVSICIIKYILGLETGLKLRKKKHPGKWHGEIIGFWIASKNNNNMEVSMKPTSIKLIFKYIYSPPPSLAHTTLHSWPINLFLAFWNDCQQHSLAGSYVSGLARGCDTFSFQPVLSYQLNQKKESC